MHQYVCEKNMCTACKACLSVCPTGAVQVKEDPFSSNAVIDPDKCISCGACEAVCQVNHPLKLKESVQWNQGWSNDPAQREQSSSGGIAAEVEKAFIAGGGEVCSCVFSSGHFRFYFADSVEKVSLFTGSKYVKSNPEGVYEQIKGKLLSGKKILFVALPCQVAALYSYLRRKKVAEDCLFTIDLICHGTPSPQVLQHYLKGKKESLTELSSIIFRHNVCIKLYRDGIVEEPYFIDSYTNAFLKSYTYTENCYHCQYAQNRRISDLTLGDSWGTDLPSCEMKKGLSLILCQTEKGRQLLKSADVHLLPVDLEHARKSNGQLNEPSPIPQKREAFCKRIVKGRSFNYAMLCAEPLIELKNIAKIFLGKLHLRKKQE